MELKTHLLTSMAKVFPDEEPVNCMEINSLSAFRNEKAAFQLAFSASECAEVIIDIPEGMKAYQVISVPVIKACDNNTDDYYLRKKPGLYPDVLKPYKGEKLKAPKDVWMSIYFENESLTAGRNVLSLILRNPENEEIYKGEFTLTIIDALLPPQTLICTNWFHCDSIASYYNVPVFSEKFWEITERFVKTAVEHGINFILTPLFTPPLDTEIGSERLTVQLVGVEVTDSGYKFDFSNLIKWIRMCRKCGVEYFEMSHLFTQWGALHAPKIKGTVNGEEKTIFGWDTDSTGEEYTAFLTALAPELTEVLEAEGVSGHTYFHVSDEPGENDLEVYGKLNTLMHKLFGKKFKIFDALSEYSFYEKGYTEIPVPSEASIEDFAGKVPELWTYYCCGPTDRYYSNRFMAMPLQRTRIIGMQLYKYGVKGFLHWGYNFYFSQLSVRKINPFAETDAGGAFSSGDAFVVYPGDDGTPWASLRLKAMDEGFRDMRALQMLESRIGREKTLEFMEENNGEKFNMSFTEYPKSEKWHFMKREEINKKIAELL